MARCVNGDANRETEASVRQSDQLIEDARRRRRKKKAPANERNETKPKTTFGS